MKNYLVTGSAGFIGYHLCERLLREGHGVVGLDNLNSYYSVELKEARNARLKGHPGYGFRKVDLADRAAVERVFASGEFDSVFHLAAQAGVRHSLENPRAYLSANIDGTLNVLEGARAAKRKPSLWLASSSSVYGLSDRLPFREDDAADRPAALYGATKRANELMGHAYAHLFGLRVTMLRFFTVYGPWGRPDMALFRFVKSILAGEEIELYNDGDMTRDFTYVDDIVDGVLGLARAGGRADYDVFNIGGAAPCALPEFVRAIEAALGMKARVRMAPLQPGDVRRTSADVSKIRAACGYAPKVGLEEGVSRFVQWYREFYRP